MKILIAYYSKTKNTEKLAEKIKNKLEKRGHSVDFEKIEPVKEHSFWAWFFIRIFKGKYAIKDLKIQDLFQYDVVCIGSPNWTRLSLPVAKYLEVVKGLKYKKIGFFATTFLWPHIEWYIFSAYLLDFTFSRIIERKKGRIIANILLSSKFKKWDLNSKNGQETIERFCNKIEAPIPSLEEYILDEKEVSRSRALVIIFSTLLVFSLLFQIISSVAKTQIFNWTQYSYFFVIGFVVWLLILIVLEERKNAFLAKYISGALLTIAWTFFVLFLVPTLGRIIILGYIIIFILISFFQSLRAVIFSGLIASLSYIFLLLNFPQKQVLNPTLDLLLIFIGLGLIFLNTKLLKKHFVDLLKTQEEVEMAKVNLEIKIKARTRELEELTQGLEDKVKERTKELQERVDELERFHRLTVGRETKMIELKEKIKRLEGEIKKYKEDE